MDNFILVFFLVFLVVKNGLKIFGNIFLFILFVLFLIEIVICWFICVVFIFIQGFWICCFFSLNLVFESRFRMICLNKIV